MTFLAIIAIGGIAIPLAERTFLPYAHAAKDLNDKWIDVTLPPRVAQFRLMLRIWSETIANLSGKLAGSLLPLSVRWSLWALELALIGVVAEMVMVLPMAVYFHRATTFAVPTNMLSVPLVAVLAPTLPRERSPCSRPASSGPRMVDRNVSGSSMGTLLLGGATVAYLDVGRGLRVASGSTNGAVAGASSPITRHDGGHSHRRRTR